MMDEIIIGDVVIYTTPSGQKLSGAVSGISGSMRRVWLSDGRALTIGGQRLIKTGRTVDVNRWMNEIKGVKND